MNPSAGDTVRIDTKTKSYEGKFLPKPELLDQSKIVLKLESGYNIGIQKSDVKNITILKKYTAPKGKKTSTKANKNLPTIALLTCGGTIASRLDYKTGGVISNFDDQGVTGIDSNDFVSTFPELKDIANIKTVNVLNTMSEDLDATSYATIATAIKKELDDKKIDGIIVTQGTDTLHYTTSAVSFMLQNISKPVVFTAAQRSVDRGSSDAFQNLMCSAHAALHKPCSEIVTCLHGTVSDDYCLLIRGTKVRKMHTSRRDAFRPINDKALAKVWPNGKIQDSQDWKKSTQKNDFFPVFDKKVGILHIHPGVSPKLVDFFIENKYKGLVVSATALGHVPTNSKISLIGPLKKAVKAGMVVVVASQTLYGRVNPYVYSNLRQVSLNAGCLYAEDMLPETAFTKLSWALGMSKKSDEVKTLFSTNLSGELNKKLTEEMFLN